MSMKKRTWGRGSVHHRSVGSGSSNERVRQIKGEIGDEVPLSRSSEMGRDRKWEVGGVRDVLAETGAPVEVRDAVATVLCECGLCLNGSLVEWSCNVSRRGGQQRITSGALLRQVLASGAEDADGSGDSFDINERRFSAAGRDAGNGGRWEVGEASLRNVITTVLVA
ncbi:unnamed protein product, partial [Musa acuminata var. zebrina]